MTKHPFLLALPFLVPLAFACGADFESKPCPAGHVPDNANGVCRPCEAGTVVDTSSGQCKACEVGFAPDAGGQCAPESQNAAGAGGSGGGGGRGGAGGSGGQGGSTTAGSGGASGGGGSGGGPVDVGLAHLRVVHLSPDAGDLKVCARRRDFGASAPFDQVVQPSIAYANMSAYVDVPATQLDYRLVSPTAGCGTPGLAPDVTSLDFAPEGQYATLVLAGLRNPTAIGGVPPDQALGGHLLLEPQPFVGEEAIVEARLSAFTIKGSSLRVGAYLDILPNSSFIPTWSPAQYGTVATTLDAAYSRPYSYRLYGFGQDESLGIDAPPHSSTEPDVFMFGGPQYYGDFQTARVNLFLSGIYNGSSTSVELITCEDRQPNEPAACQKAALRTPD